MRNKTVLNWFESSLGVTITVSTTTTTVCGHASDWDPDLVLKTYRLMLGFQRQELGCAACSAEAIQSC